MTVFTPLTIRQFIKYNGLLVLLHYYLNGARYKNGWKKKSHKFLFLLKKSKFHPEVEGYDKEDLV